MNGYRSLHHKTISICLSLIQIHCRIIRKKNMNQREQDGKALNSISTWPKCEQDTLFKAYSSIRPVLSSIYLWPVLTQYARYALSKRSTPRDTLGTARTGNGLINSRIVWTLEWSKAQDVLPHYRNGKSSPKIRTCTSQNQK